MAFVVSAVGDMVSGFLGADAARGAAKSDMRAADMSIAEQRRQFDEMQKLFAPFVQAGTNSLGGIQRFEQTGGRALGQIEAMSGLLGDDEQQKSLQKLESSPLFKSLYQQGENAILQNASATGGLRGGNIQDALSNFRSNLLNSIIAQQYARFGDLANTGFGASSNLAQLGQGSAAGQAAGGQSMASNIGNLYSQRARAEGNMDYANAAMMNVIPNTFAQTAGNVAGFANNFIGGRF